MYPHKHIFRLICSVPTKRPNQLPPHRDPNLSITSADESFDTYTIDSPTERAVENSRIIHSRINEEDESRDLHLPDRNTFLGEDNHVTREETRVIRQEGDRVVTEVEANFENFPCKKAVRCKNISVLSTSVRLLFLSFEVFFYFFFFKENFFQMQL